jgi:epoxide hydrolase-like predicted phosphatase
MRQYHYLCISFLLICMCTCTKLQHKEDNTATLINSKKYAIIFGLINVLVEQNQMGFSKKIGYGNLASYTLTHWKNPGHRCLDMLEAISKQKHQRPHLIITINKRILPRCLIEFNEGKKECSEVKKEIAQSIEQLDADKFFTSAKEKTLMMNIMNTALDPTTTATLIEQIKPALQLVHKLKSAGYRVYILANAPHELYVSVQKKYPDMLALFDGIIISSQVKISKPDPTIFNHLLSTYNLTPQECILVDDGEENITTAKKMGMTAILYDKSSNVISNLKKCGVKL